MKNRKWDHVFTMTIPENLEKDTLYISLDFNTVIHLCACGCGEEVSTPLHPKQWKLTYDGEVISLSPSIGNWSYQCRSHYWIRGNEVVWAENWSDEKVKQARELDKKLWEQKENTLTGEKVSEQVNGSKENRLRSWFKKLFG